MADPQFLLDSDICIYTLTDAASALTAKIADQEEGALAISSITLAEVAIGYGDRVDTDVGLRNFLDAVIVLPFDDQAARTYARLPFRRARFDRLIAAHALSLCLTLVTNNERDFADVPGLKVENWTLPR
jgi:tRNA(fMet)-specific endonuclease VapC